jgi:glucokinase
MSLASGTALVERARDELGLKGKNLEEMLMLDDRPLRPLFKEASFALAALFYNLSMGLHLQKILISGGMVKIQERFLPKAIQVYRAWIKARNPAFECPIEVAKLGDRAGFFGAAYLPFNR